MAVIKFYLSAKKGTAGKQQVYCEILHYLTNGERIHKRFRTLIFAPQDYWNDQLQGVSAPKARLLTMAQRQLNMELNDINMQLLSLRSDIEELLMTRGWNETRLKNLFCGSHKEQEEMEPPLADGMEKYADEARLSHQRSEHYKVVARMVRRFCEYEGRTLLASDTTVDDLDGFCRFVEAEHTLCNTSQYKKRVVSKERAIQQRGSNRVVNVMKFLRAYFHHLAKVGKIENDPFTRFEMPAEVYGTPYYITQEELRQVYECRTLHGEQRDVFVFQCCVGCRVSDLQKLTWENVEEQDGVYWLSYIPQKTSNERAQVARIPLNDMAVEIMMRYRGCCGKKLLPCISQGKYNLKIKMILSEAHITRRVTIRDSKSGQSKQVRICDVASSHMARRTFCGGLYNQGVDSRVICSMSGHTEGSRAFSRYVQVSDEQLKQAVLLLGSKANP